MIELIQESGEFHSTYGRLVLVYGSIFTYLFLYCSLYAVYKLKYIYYYQLSLIHYPENMSFKEFIKNPSEFIFNRLDKNEQTSEDNSPQESMSLGDAVEEDKKNTILSKIMTSAQNFVKKVTSVDWAWLLTGKTGLFLKITIPLIIVLSLIQPYIAKEPSVVVGPPNQVDPGDDVPDPVFEPSGYLYGSESEGNFLIYSSKIDQINELGYRGIVLDKIETESTNNVYLPLDKGTHVFFDGNSLKLSYLQEVSVEENSNEDSTYESVEKELITNISNLSDVQNLHKTSDGNVVFTHIPSIETNSENLNEVEGENERPETEGNTNSSRSIKFLYIFDSRGELIKRIPLLLENISSLTFLNNEVYFFRESNGNHYLVHLNSNNEEILNLNLGEFKPHKMYVLNSNRFLIAFEQPSNQSFFFVKMIDDEGNVFFQFTPQEEVQKITSINSLTLNQDDNQILFVGDNLAKLFNIRGEQLWIR